MSGCLVTLTDRVFCSAKAHCIHSYSGWKNVVSGPMTHQAHVMRCVMHGLITMSLQKLMRL